MTERYRTESGPVALGLLAIVLLLLAGAGSWYAMRQAQTERDRALELAERQRLEAAWAEATAELQDDRARTEAMLEFLAQQLEQADPTGGPQPTVREVLASAEQQAAGTELSPEVREALLRAIEDARDRLDSR